MLRFDWLRRPEPLYCRFLWHAATVLCDGTVTCGLDDPFAVRNYGNLRSATLREIMATAAIARRRRDLQAGVRCEACAMYEPAAGADAGLRVPSHPYPKRLVVEPSIRCNIRCHNETCDIANDHQVRLRRENYLAWDLYRRLLDEAGPHLDELYFYNYGEPFLHPRALDMLAYAKQVNPRIRVTTSTNGILLARDGRAERLVSDRLVDFICFTIGGVDQATYARYHKAGSFDAALSAMRRMMAEKRRLGLSLPTVHWRYLLFDWNDSDECIAKALRWREEIGVDEFRFMLTGSPIEGRSLRRAPGTRGFDAIRPWLALQDGYAPDPFAEAGLWGPEHGRFSGPFSWTSSRARLLGTPRDGQLRLRLASGGDRTGAMPGVLLRLPWGETPARVGRKGWGRNLIAVPRSFAAPQVPIDLQVDGTWTPMRHGLGTDNRELGVMVSLRDVQPAPNPWRVAAVPVLRASGCSRGT